MVCEKQNVATADDPFAVVEAALTASAGGPAALEGAVRTLGLVAEAAQVAADDEASQCARRLAQLVQIVACADEGSGPDDGGQLRDFLLEALTALKAALQNEPGRSLQEVIDESQQRWGDWLELIRESDGGDSLAGDADDELSSPEDPADEGPEHSAAQVELILSAIQTSAPSAKQRDEASPPAPPALDLDGDLVEAYLDDANHCLAAIESAVLAYEQPPHDSQALQQICRELHTLKGASASVGLTALADYLHEVEETVQASCAAPQDSRDVQPILAAVDAIRQHIAQLGAPGKSAESAGPQPAQAAPRLDSAGEAHEETLRVRASQLEGLMDMLAEMVVLRNRRESRVAELRRLGDELIRCATRLRVGGDFGTAAHSVHPLSEVAADVLEIARGKRAVCERIAAEDLALSRFIRDFRQELMQLRRLPISGLFRRLQRAVRDAARAAGKEVRFELRGEHAGLERSLQERLYEPLLHIVRNAVSHGIETAERRKATGKDPVGTVTLEARGGTNLLVLEVRDDGQGLNYDALRQRALQRGLISPDQLANREELARLIFHPGLSTRDEADGLAGRGVGMDVVAETLNHMRGWVEVQSAPGEGTQIRLSIPLRSVIEHTMVFRAGGQLFAVPMPFVQRADGAARGGPAQVADETPTAHFAALFGASAADERDGPQRLLLGYARASATRAETHAASPAPTRRFALLVDKIIGPEEVVVRPLPALLRQQDLFSGVSLSGAGELVLLFDARRLIELGLHHVSLPPETSDSPAAPPGASSPAPPARGGDRAQRQRALVVDDSISARRVLVRALERRGLETVEAADGREALDWLRTGEFAVVFSDLEMPRLSGLDLLREMSQMLNPRETPLVMVSSRSEDKIRNTALEMGAVRYLSKPVTESVVTGTLEQLGLLPAASVEGESN